MNRRPIHCFCYGESGVGKSTFAATWPKPMRVFHFDPYGKDIAYITACIEAGGKPGEVYQHGDNFFLDLEFPDGLIRIQYFHDGDMDAPTAYQRFTEALSTFRQHESGQYKTIVLDSVTSMGLAARKREEKVLNPFKRFEKNKDMRQWWAASTDALEEVLCGAFGAFQENVLVLLHVDKDTSVIGGQVTRGPGAPGRLSSNNVLGAYFQEQYYLMTYRDEAGNLHRAMQTSNRDGYQATSLIKAPDPCYPHYESLWVNWDALGK